MEGKALIKRLYDNKGTPLLAVAAIALFVLEKRYVLRKRKVSLLQRLTTNGKLAAVAAVGLRLALIPALVGTATIANGRKMGILNIFKGFPVLRQVIAFLILDYGNYQWHKLTHKIPFLWRMHQVHHADLDLDVSTALRFHLGEVLISVLYRAAWIFFFGISPKLVLIYEISFEAANNFHHSNLNLPSKVDQILASCIVTPRMHGIHHSVVKAETDSNFCIIFTFWDKIHNTWRYDIPQDQITIGVPYVRSHLGVKELLLMPSKKTPAWAFPDGKIPKRETIA